jgi:WD40 repeat protein
MNRIRHIATALSLVLATGAGAALAGNGSGAADGTGPMHDIYSGICDTVSGTLAEVTYNGSGYILDTGSDTLTLYGMGPVSYWDALGVALPQVGETLDAEVCWVTFSDTTTKAIATAVTLSDGTLVELRDASTGQPLWRGTSGSGVQAAAGGGGQVQAAVGGRGR